MTWIQTTNDRQRGLKRPWMDEKVWWTSNGKANVPADVADRLVREDDRISYVHEESAGGDDDDPAPNATDPEDEDDHD